MVYGKTPSGLESEKKPTAKKGPSLRHRPQLGRGMKTIPLDGNTVSIYAFSPEVYKKKETWRPFLQVRPVYSTEGTHYFILEVVHFCGST